jgi:hypothetical protein
VQEKAEQGIWPTKAPLGYRNITGPDGKKIIAIDLALSPIVAQMDTASDRVPVTSRTPATKAKMAQSIVRSAHEGIRDAQQLVAVAVAEGMVPAL